MAYQKIVIPLDMSANQNSQLHLLFRAMLRGNADPAEDLIARLREIEDARADFLADNEYADFRNMALRQIVEPMPVPLMWQLTLIVCCLGSISLIVFGIMERAGGAVIGGSAGFLAGVYIWYGLARDYATKRAMGRDERLQTIDRLVSMHLVSKKEAIDLKSKILAEFPVEVG